MKLARGAFETEKPEMYPNLKDGVEDAKGRWLHIGDRVRVKVQGNPRARISYFMTDVVGGLVLDKVCGGSRSWNAKDVVKL